MSPPPINTKSSCEEVHKLSAAEVRETLDFARELSKTPYRLSDEQRAQIKADILSALGYT